MARQGDLWLGRPVGSILSLAGLEKAFAHKYNQAGNHDENNFITKRRVKIDVRGAIVFNKSMSIRLQIDSEALQSGFNCDNPMRN